MHRYLCVLSSAGFLMLSVFVYRHLKINLVDLCDLSKCPYCYGTDLCVYFKNGDVTLVTDSLDSLIFNYVNTKNVYLAKFHNKSVIIKKLAHDKEISEFDDLLCTERGLGSDCSVSEIHDVFDYKSELVMFLNHSEYLSNFKTCSEDATMLFLDLILRNKPENVSEDIYMRQVWTILKLNVEPLLLQIFNADAGWPVPKHYGGCGRLVMQEDCGMSLNSQSDIDWIDRAYLAYQLLQAAKNFTENHEHFRLYLTDVSPDNVAVNYKLHIAFVDLENAILSIKNDEERTQIHHSEVFEGDEFAFSPESICENSISDHNFYAICKLLLSPEAPWPMMKNGLLHSVPDLIVDEYPQLLKSIGACVRPRKNLSRFEASENILNVLAEILYLYRN